MSTDALHNVFYTRLQRRLHWLVILLVTFQYSSQSAMRVAMGAVEQQITLNFVQFLVTTLHTWSGITIAIVMLWRWQLRSRVVPLNGGHMHGWKERVVKANHVSVYLVMFVMASSGAMHYYFGWHIAARWHELGKWILLALIVSHVVGAFYHAFRGSTVLRRMMGSSSLR